jgi:hypothetical protein
MIALDSHVHFHECFDEEVFLNAAVSNVRRASAGGPIPKLLVLCLTECRGVSWFESLRTRGVRGSGWNVRKGLDSVSLKLTHPDQMPVLLVAGRQIVCRERIEVLALGAREEVEDGQPVADVLTQVESIGALPVLPWGFGKWVGRRGSIVAKLIAEQPVGRLWVGDNAGRPHGTPRPKLFAEAELRGIHILPGSDALPFRDEVGKAGRVGFLMDIKATNDLCGMDVLDAIRHSERQPKGFGRQETPWRFLRNQLAMQARKLA